MSWAYLACLLFSLAGMAILDLRHRLFWFADARRAAIVHGLGLAAFLAWDGLGILTGIFHRGDSPYMTGIDLAPELPLEELFFLVFLCWLTMNLYTGGARILRARAGRARAGIVRPGRARAGSGISHAGPGPAATEPADHSGRAAHRTGTDVDGGPAGERP
ncbi:lycopene cyclase domain-containing protein [Brevibacterium pityocampae]